MKFDAAQPDERPGLDVPGLLRQIGVKIPTQSCWSPAALTPARRRFWRTCCRGCASAFPELFLILVPRHFERAKEAGQELAARGIPFVYRSDITGEKSFAPGQLQCLLVNSTGELKFFYEQAALVFVGKSLTAKAGRIPSNRRPWARRWCSAPTCRISKRS
jgi:3-deoxy-D-manno-octulosonic-acid transferase